MVRTFGSAGIALFLVAGSAFAQCGTQAAAPEHDVRQASQAATTPADIVDTAVAAGSFKTLAAALQAAGLVDTLKGKGPFTVFAPTDEAFAKLPAGTVENLLKPENRDLLRTILTYHVVQGQVLAADVKPGPVTTVSGQRFQVVVKDGKVTLDGIGADATVTATDIRASNGVIHVIDRVILPSDKDIIQIATAAGSFTTLARALEVTGLVEALRGKGPFTVFAPTDEAFAKLPAGTLDNLLKPENRQQLTDILLLHVVPSRVFSDAAARGATVKTLQGGSVTTKSEAGKVTVNGATVLNADIEASNGVIHVIDTVILPK